MTDDKTTEQYYKLGRGLTTKVLPEQIFIMLTAIPILMSYDIYTFVYSLIREPIIFTSLDKLNFLKKILNILFFESDRDKIIKDLTERMKQFYKLEQIVTEYEKNKAELELVKIKKMTTIEFENFIKSQDKNGTKIYYESFNKRNEMLRSFRSISSINKDFINLDIRLKVNIDSIYQIIIIK